MATLLPPPVNLVVELLRAASPFPKPQGIFHDGAILWISSRATGRLYAVDRASLTVSWDAMAEDGQTVWGVTRHRDALYVVCGVDAPDVDARTVRRVIPFKGFDPSFSIPCPDGVGSHLSHDGQSLVLSQWYPKKLISLGLDGTPGRVLRLPREVVGHCFAKGAFWIATTTEEESNDYFVERCDPLTGRCEPLGRIGFPCRGLSYDGAAFWTNHREAGQIVSFRLA